MSQLPLFESSPKTSALRLNKGQETAAAHAEGPALTLAGAGTGKTTTLVARFERLVKRGVPPNYIFVVTFTVKAAEEMKERILATVPEAKDSKNLFIGTFHSLCARMLRRWHNSVDLAKNFDILDPSGQRQMMSGLGIYWDSDDGDILDIISRWKDSMIRPDEAFQAATAKGDRLMIQAAEHYASYQEEMDSRGAVDFADLIWKVVHGMQDDPSFRSWFHKRFQHVLVDEFQDVNKLQVEFLKLALNKQRNIWCVGDDDQALYSWRGSDVRYAVNFRDLFKGAAVYTLTENYRSPPIVVSAGNAVISNNQHRVRKSLVAMKVKAKGDAVVIRGFDNDRKEAEWVADRAKQLIESGVKPSGICVLFRSGAVAPALQKAFEDRQVPFVLRGAQSFWTLPEVRTFVAILKLIARPGDRDAEKLLGDGKRGRDFKDLARTMKGSTFAESIPPAARVVGSTPPNTMDAERKAQWGDACDQASEEAGRFDSFHEFFEFAEKMEAAKPDDARREGVAISTIHSAKGLEWQHVFVAACEKAMLPHAKSDDEEEERRLFYVAVTRAMRTLILTYGRSRFGRGQMPSPFLDELESGVDKALGLFTWIGRDGDAPMSAPEKGQAAKSSANASVNAKGTVAKVGGTRVKVFRRGVGRSLIPPGERDD